MADELVDRAGHGAARSRMATVRGLAFILATSAIWIITSFLSASLVTPSEAEAKAAVHPFLLTYLATSLFTLYIPLTELGDYLRARRRRRSTLSDGRHRRQLHEGEETAPLLLPPRNDDDESALSEEEPRHIEGKRNAMSAAAWAMPIWVAAQFSFNYALALTSVTSNTILSSTSSFFTFLLSMAMLGERFTVGKVAAIGACITGTALMALKDTETSGAGSAPLAGDLLTVLAAALYAGYTVIMRRKMPGEEAEAHVATFFGYLGLYSTVFLAPLVAFCQFQGIFALADIPKSAYIIIVLEGLLDYVLSDYLWARAVMLLGPTGATLGLSIQIPMAAGTDAVMGKAPWVHTTRALLMTLAGTALILSGFSGINLAGGHSDKGQTQRKQDAPREGIQNEAAGAEQGPPPV